MIRYAHDFIVRVDVRDILAEGVHVFLNVLSGVTEVEADTIVPIMSVKRCEIMLCSVIILRFVFFLESSQIFHLKTIACFALFLFLLKVHSLEFKLLIHRVVYSSGNDFYTD